MNSCFSIYQSKSKKAKKEMVQNQVAKFNISYHFSSIGK